MSEEDEVGQSEGVCINNTSLEKREGKCPCRTQVWRCAKMVDRSDRDYYGKIHL